LGVSASSGERGGGAGLVVGVGAGAGDGAVSPRAIAAANAMARNVEIEPRHNVQNACRMMFLPE
jgi:hypothetical protein